MSELKPRDTINKILISTPSYFKGGYKHERPDFLITHAWPTMDRFRVSGYQLVETPYTRSYFVVAFKSTKKHTQQDITPPANSKRIEEIICIYLSILFGKRFDYHGFLEALGMFQLPNLDGFFYPHNYKLPINNRSVRKDLEIELNLTKISLIEDLLFSYSLDQRFLHFLHFAGKFYLSALQNFEEQPEVAFLHLITAGEILSNFYDYDANELLKDKEKQDLKRIEDELLNGNKVAKRIRNILTLTKRRYTKTIISLLNDYFFTHTESVNEFCSLKKSDVEQRIKASYDLRSSYVHSGVPFGIWITSSTGRIEEIQVGSPVVKGIKFQKALKQSPTLFGMERIIRFCLLRFLQKNGIIIDENLEGDGLISN